MSISVRMMRSSLKRVSSKLRTWRVGSVCRLTRSETWRGQLDGVLSKPQTWITSSIPSCRGRNAWEQELQPNFARKIRPLHRAFLPRPSAWRFGGAGGVFIRKMFAIGALAPTTSRGVENMNPWPGRRHVLYFNAGNSRLETAARTARAASRPGTDAHRPASQRSGRGHAKEAGIGAFPPQIHA
jgi:hypothetical protein